VDPVEGIHNVNVKLLKDVDDLLVLE